MAATRAGRIGWDIGSTTDITSEDYTQMIVELFRKGEPHYVEMLDQLCSEVEDDEEETHPFNQLVAMIGQ